VRDGGLEHEILRTAIDQDGLVAMTWAIKQVRKPIELLVLLAIVRAFVRDMKPEQLASLSQDIQRTATDQDTHLVIA
jgi:hypothetical protein